MDLVQLHTLEPLSVAVLARELRARIDVRWLERWAVLSADIVGPWRPADVWPGGLERLVWSATFHYPDGGFFTSAGEVAASGVGTLGKRHAPVHPAEIVAGAFGGALVLWHSDPGRSAYASIWRERRLRWSLRLDAGERLVRCDGERVIVESPPRHLPEGDRAGVLLAGWERLLGERLDLEGGERLTLVDTLGSLTAEARPERLFAHGEWAGERAAVGRRTG